MPNWSRVWRSIKILLGGKMPPPPYDPSGTYCWHCGWHGKSKEELWAHLDDNHTY